MILVNGLLNLDAGKTVMAYSITKTLRKEGFKVVPFKPIGAVDIWRASWILKELEESHSVLSGDAIVLSSAISKGVNIRKINPVALVLTPIDPARFSWASRPYENLMVNMAKRASLMRITSCSPEDEKTIHFLNAKALQRSPREVRRTIEGILETLVPSAIKVNDNDIEKIFQSSVPKAESCLANLLSKNEAIVIESHDDTAMPIPSALEADLVISVAPGKAAILEGEEFRKVVLTIASINSSLALNSREILTIANISNEVNLPILSYPLQEGYPDEILLPIINKIKELISR